MPLLVKRTVMAAVAESTLGTAASLSASNASFYAYDMECDVEVEENPREYQGTASPLTSTPGPRRMVMRFKTDIHGLGSLGVPAWAVLLNGCSMYDDTNTYKLATGAPAASGNVGRTLTIGFYHDGRRMLAAGCMGNAKIVLQNGSKGHIEWEFTGAYSAVADVTLITPTLPTVVPPRAANLTMTYDSWTPPGVKTVEIDLGNEVYLREDLSSGGGSAGYAHAIITNRRPVITMTPDAVLVATKDIYSALTDQSAAAFSCALGATQYNILTFAAAAAQVIEATPQAEDMLWKDSITLLCTRSAANDDELTIAFT